MITRDDVRVATLDALRKHAPDLAVDAAVRIMEAPAIQRWFDSIERRRPRGIVAWVRRLRRGRRGVSASERKAIEEFVIEAVRREREK
jgi:hypothetical protein